MFTLCCCTTGNPTLESHLENRLAQSENQLALSENRLAQSETGQPNKTTTRQDFFSLWRLRGRKKVSKKSV